MSSIGRLVRAAAVIGFLPTFLLSNALVSPSTAWTDIELAVDTANFNQDGLLVLFGGLRLQGHVGLPVGAGDINGDGRADVIICGMYGSVFPRENNGVVSFYLSDGRDSGFIDAAENPANIFKLTGQRAGDLLGTSVSANADINGDGIKDVAIGAAGWDAPGAGVTDNRGAAYVVYGSPNFNQNADLSTVDGNPPPGVVAIYAPQSGARAGIWVDEGDIDGDGLGDVIIGADEINFGGSQHVGGAYIVFGSRNLPSVIDLAAPPSGVRTARIVGPRQEEHWGAALQVGDVNNDGIGDIIIGGSINRDSASYVSPGLDNGHEQRAAGFGGLRPFCGEAYVIYGQPTWPADVFLGTPPANATHIIGAHSDDYLGSQVHSGDLNGDGRTDLVIGALRAQAPDDKGQTGAVYVIYGSPNLPGATIDLLNPVASGLTISSIYGEHSLDCAGDSVRTYDINKDGLSDLFVGSPERTFEVNGEDRDDAGVTEIIYGQRDLLPPVIKFYDPPASPRIFRLAGAHGAAQGIDGGDEFSYRLAGGDVDGDGYIDYISNAMHGDGIFNRYQNAGNVYIFSGRKLSAKLGMLSTPDPAPVLSSAVLQNAQGQAVQEANAGTGGLRIIVNGTGFRADTEISINGVVVVSQSPSNPQLAATQRTVNLDENLAVRNIASPLVVRARNTNPSSDQSNAITAGRLIGLEISSIRPKRKASGIFLLKISGLNFQEGVTVQVTGAGGQAIPVKSVSFQSTDAISAKIRSSDAPQSGASIRVKAMNPGGAVSNEVIITAP